MGEEIITATIDEEAAAAAPPAEPVKPSASPPRPTSLYFVNWFVDIAVIGGISILTYCLLRVFHDGSRTEVATGLAMALAWVCNWPHFSATNYRLYHARANIMQYPMTALVVPWIILAGMAGSFLAPLLLAPIFIKLFLIWSPYHFSGQTLGITLIYARRCGFPVGRWERLGLSTFIFGTFITMTARFEVSTRGDQFYGIHYPTLGLPDWIPVVLDLVTHAGGVLFLILAGRWMWRNGRGLPPILLVPALAQYFWFMVGAGWMSFVEFVPFFHSLQYLLIAWSMQLKEKMDLRHIAPSPRYVFSESVLWGLLNFLGGVALFYYLPRAASLVTGVEILFATGVVISAVQIHHFFVDGVIWKLKRQTVASPLMVNIHDMLSAPPARAAA